jgi:2-amino-4-hydroxy-6-hydroxymethyldihydropteridine diphosphokinase
LPTSEASGDFHTAFVGIGSNVGDRVSHCTSAVEGLARDARVTLFAVSSFYETHAISSFSQPDYINCAVKIGLRGTARDLLRYVAHVENMLGRVRGTPKGPRTIDLDILLFSSQIINEPDLVIPHPELHRRMFALIPCLEIEPTIVHPVFGIRLIDFLNRISHEQGVVSLQGPPVGLLCLCKQSGPDFLP